MGIGSARGDDRSVAAAEMAISSPLLEASIDGAHGVLLSISGGSDLGLFEINEAAQLVSDSAASDANIIFGAVIDDALGDEVRVTVIAAGFDEGSPSKPALPAAQNQRVGEDARQAQPAIAPSVVAESAAPRPVAPAADPPGGDGEPPTGGPGAMGRQADPGDDEAGARPKVPRPATEPPAARVTASEPVRRRPVVFDEDDDLDVPDFLK
jgi:cell division protein FtsZ